MTFLRIALALSVGFAAALAANAQELNGRWSGSADWTDGGGTKRTQTTVVEIKHEAGKLTAHSIGGNGKIGAPIQIQTDGGKVNLSGSWNSTGASTCAGSWNGKTASWPGVFRHSTTIRRSGCTIEFSISR